MITILSQKASRLLVDPDKFYSSPFTVFIKDIDGCFLGCNDLLSNIAGLSPAELVGKTDFELSWKDNASIYRGNELSIMENGKPKFFYEFSEFDDSRHDFLFLKAPLLAKDESVIGVFGAGVKLNQKSIEQVLEEILMITRQLHFKIDIKCLLRLTTNIVNRINLEANIQTEQNNFHYDNIEFTIREAQCLHYLLRNQSASQTASFLSISQKTVEYHLANIKNKLRCKTRAEIFNQSLALGFIDLMFMPF